MTALSLLLALCIPAQEPGPIATGAQFKKVLDASRAGLRDLALVYEGRLEWVGPESLLGVDPKAFNKSFQGNYLYRSDGAALIDLYTRGTTDKAVVIRLRKSAFKDVFSQAQMITDLDQEEFFQSPGSTSMMSGPDSFHTLFYYPLYDTIRDINAWGYEFRGWEDVDGRRCARIKLNWTAGPSPWYRLLWIDVERNGHPLKDESHDEGGMFARLDRVELARFEGPDRQGVWVPVKGTLEGFKWKNVYSREPSMRQTFEVVRGSVVVNEGLSDALFKVEPTPTSPISRRLDRAAAALPLRKAFLESQPGRPRRTDTKSIEKRIDEALEEADRQGDRLEASAPSREAWTWGGVGGWAAILLGVGAIVAAGVLLVLSGRRR